MKNKQTYFVTGIGTNVGKTVVSAIVCKAMNADYWKPVQCGNLDDSDSWFVQTYAGSKTYPEAYRLKMPASPHLAAKSENVSIDLHNFILPETDKQLIIEGAGGMLVPLNEENDLVIDIAKKFNSKLIIVSAFYLGSINHTLLTLEAAKHRGLTVEWLIFSGEKNTSTIEIIQKFYPQTKVAFVPQLEIISEDSITQVANNFKNEFFRER